VHNSKSIDANYHFYEVISAHLKASGDVVSPRTTSYSDEVETPSLSMHRATTTASSDGSLVKAALYCVVLYCAVLYCTVLYCTVLYCYILCYIILHHAALYYSALYHTVLFLRSLPSLSLFSHLFSLSLL
jgi:hypothetical protein